MAYHSCSPYKHLLNMVVTPQFLHHFYVHTHVQETQILGVGSCVTGPQIRGLSDQQQAFSEANLKLPGKS